jgi:hypothetical protein
MSNENRPSPQPRLWRRSGAIWIVGPVLVALGVLTLIFLWPARERVTPGDQVASPPSAGAPAPAAPQPVTQP